MGWLALLGRIADLIGALANWLRDRRASEAARASIERDELREASDGLAEVARARAGSDRAGDADARGLRDDDGFRRD